MKLSVLRVKNVPCEIKESNNSKLEKKLKKNFEKKFEIGYAEDDFGLYAEGDTVGIGYAEGDVYADGKYWLARGRYTLRAMPKVALCRGGPTVGIAYYSCSAPTQPLGRYIGS